MKQANWIKSSIDMGTICPTFQKEFNVEKKVVSATLYITAMGVYEAVLNGERVGEFILAPGFTSYHKRHQYQTYDITSGLREKNVITVNVGNGWYCGYLAWMNQKNFYGKTPALIAEIVIEYEDGIQRIVTDSTWNVAKSEILSSELYHGEVYDARIKPEFTIPVEVFESNKDPLILQQGEIVKEQEYVKPVDIFVTPKGETVIDFGQNLTGYVMFQTIAHAGEEIEYSHGEILDPEGNFYRDNLRTAEAKIRYICKEGEQSYKPHHTFMGFRYIRVEKAPRNIQFTAIVVHSDMKRTGFFTCGNTKINQLYHNIIWGQKGNFLDIPTDCPQRDERLGWTGDAQVFIRAASYNYDVNKFFHKWLADVKADQLENGSIPHVIPNILENNDGSTAWGDAAVICPWQIYVTYGDKSILKSNFESMKKWIQFSQNPNRFHFGDWLALDEPEENNGVDSGKQGIDLLKGHSNQHLISDAYWLYSTSIVIKAGKILGEDVSEFEQLYVKRLQEFRDTYTYKTQTECALAIYFDLAVDKEKVASQLAELVRKNGNRLQTGFVGTPYLLHALSQTGYEKVAYDLLLQEAYPSWLFSVNHGATTIWEHWDGVKEDGSLTECGMNSYNHYAYGAVADWMYMVCAGIRIEEESPAFEHILLQPIVDRRMGFVSASVLTKYGLVQSKWWFEEDGVHYHFVVPKGATIVLGKERYQVSAGTYEYIR